jgi:hypothetical protein
MSARLSQISVVPEPDGVTSPGSFIGGMVKTGCFLYSFVPGLLEVLANRIPGDREGFDGHAWARVVDDQDGAASGGQSGSR